MSSSTRRARWSPTGAAVTLAPRDRITPPGSVRRMWSSCCVGAELGKVRPRPVSGHPRLEVTSSAVEGMFRSLTSRRGAARAAATCCRSRSWRTLWPCLKVRDVFEVNRLSDVGVSRLSDNVVVLQCLPQPNSIERTLTVLKPQASLHQPQVENSPSRPKDHAGGGGSNESAMTAGVRLPCHRALQPASFMSSHQGLGAVSGSNAKV